MLRWATIRLGRSDTMIEAKKLAYADMIRYDADPRFAQVPVAGLNLQGIRGRHGQS